MRGYFFIYKRTLQSGNKIYYYQAYKPIFEREGEILILNSS